jgi:hypothetical protein
MTEPSCKALIKEQLSAAPKRKLKVDELRPLVVASLVESGKSKKKAAALFEAKLELPCFKVTDGVVKLAKREKEAATEAPSEEPPSKKAKPAAVDKPGKSKREEVTPVAASSSGGSVTMMSAAAAEAFWRENRIEVAGTGASSFRPVAAFADAGFNASVLSACETFSKPTPIQAQCWPVIMGGRDVIGVAETGSGKTLAFFLPAMMHCATPAPKGSTTPRVLVLAPTRELAMQSETVPIAQPSETLTL